MSTLLFAKYAMLIYTLRKIGFYDFPILFAQFELFSKILTERVE